MRTVIALMLAICLMPAEALLQKTAASVQAEKFPSRPITLIVPFGAGGATDIVARLIGKHVSDDLGQPVVIENRTGGAGNIGTLAAVRSPPDGHTLLVTTTTQLINQYLMKNVPYDLFTDLVPVAQLVDAPLVVAINAKLPIENLSQFVKAAQASPTGFNYGSAGIGSVPHLGGAIMARQMNTKMVHVPFRGSAEAARAVAAGTVELTLASNASVGPLVDSGLIRLLASNSSKRLPVLPNLPTAAEAGLPGVELSNWFAVFAPKGTSPDVVARLNVAINKAMALPEVSATVIKGGLSPVLDTPAQFAARLQDDAKTYRKIVQETGVSIK